MSLTTIEGALKNRAGTSLNFFNPNRGTQQHFTLGQLHRKPNTHSNTYRQGTRRYCTQCGGIMTKSFAVGRPSATIFHSSGRPGSFHEYKCPKGHTEWGQ